MDDSSNSVVLAIDGGGTRCRIALRDDNEIISVETGSANVSTDFYGGVSQIKEGLRLLSERSGHDVSLLCRLPAFVGLAGIVGDELAENLRNALPLTNVRIEDDRPAALRGALGNRDGVLAHCGTGSFYGAQMAGTMKFSGGWGSVLGDEASAQWIGRAALRGALEVVDGRAVPTELAERLLERFGGAAGVVNFGGSARPSDFGALAPLVTASAMRGDELGIAVMTSGANEIARSLPLIGWTRDVAICLTGGIGPQFKSYLPEKMQAAIVEPAGEPLSGALSLANDLARETSR